MKTTNFLYFFSTILIASMWVSNFAMASELKNGHITQEVTDFLQQKIYKQLPKKHHSGVKIITRNNDHHKRLSACDKQLTLDMHGKKVSRNASVKVSCESPSPWTVYVTATISLELPVISLQKEVNKHHILTESDLTTTIQDIYSLRDGFSTDIQTIIGKQTKRSLKSGHVLYNYHLQSPDIVKKGDRVTVVVKRGSFSVLSNGIALNNASEGDKVRVENERSSRIVHARATGPGTVEVL